MSKSVRIMDVLNHCITSEKCLGCKYEDYCRYRGGVHLTGNAESDQLNVIMAHQIHLACLTKGGYDLPW